MLSDVTPLSRVLHQLGGGVGSLTGAAPLVRMLFCRSGDVSDGRGRWILVVLGNAERDRVARGCELSASVLPADASHRNRIEGLPR